jgi:hypothetical protein
MPATPAQIPMARARSAGSGTLLARIERVVGISIEAPAACSARAPISQPSPGARLHAAEQTANRTRPVLKTRRRPTRSPVAPEVMTRLARPSTYASTTHWRSAMPACRSRPMVGSATLTAVASSWARNKLLQQIARTRCRPPPDNLNIG